MIEIFVCVGHMCCCVCLTRVEVNCVGLRGGAPNHAVPNDTSSYIIQGVDPILAYDAGQPINQLTWSSASPDWVAICLGSRVQVLRV